MNNKQTIPMNKLISMEDYVLELCRGVELHNTITFVNRVHDYAQLLKSKPTISMFVPCSDDTKSKVIFDGWDVGRKDNIYTTLINYNHHDLVFYSDGSVIYNQRDIICISDLIPYNFTLKLN